MAGRALAFSDPEIIRLGQEEFIPVAADDWYQRRREDAEGEFFRKVADQSPRKGENGSTRQGIYVLTAAGRLLAYKNAGQNPEAMRDALREGLRAWKKLPENERVPGAVKIPEPGKLDLNFVRIPPAKGLIVSVFTRVLERDEHQDFCEAACRKGGGNETARDHLWLTADEAKSLLPLNRKRGETFAVPEKIADRILRFHLVDDTRGEPPFWRPDEIRSRQLLLSVEEVSTDRIKMRLTGKALLATDPDPALAARGFDVSLEGLIEYDLRADRFSRFEIVAVGDHWGESSLTRGARPGRSPLGILFELSTGDSPAEKISPQGAREKGAYFGLYR